MKRFQFILFFFVISSFSHANEVEDIGREAAAFFAANDFEKTSSLYFQLTAKALPEWQQAILQYNLGTIKLMQNEFNESIHHFQSIHSQWLTFPSLLTAIKFNQGILFLRESASFINHPVLQRHYLLQVSMKYFNESEQLDCQLQHLQGSQDCLPAHSLALLWQNSHQQSEMLKIKEWQDNLIHSPDSVIVVFLIQSMQLLQHLADQLLNSSVSQEIQDSYSFYLTRSLKQLSFFWHKKLSETLVQHIGQKKEPFSLQDLSSFLTTALKELEALRQEHLTDFEFSLSSFILQLHQVLMNLSEERLNKLRNEWERMKPFSSKQNFPTSISHYLDLSEDKFKNDQPYLSQFFLTQTLVLLEGALTSNNQEKDPRSQLMKAILQAQFALQFQYLILLDSDLTHQNEEIKEILYEQQHNTLTAADRFIPAILLFEHSHFHEKQECQQAPWNRVIPLFESGYQSAQQALKAIKRSFDASSHQEQMIFNWQQIISLLDQSSTAHIPSTSSSRLSNRPIENVLNLIQDMEAADEPAQTNRPKEMHAW